MASDLEVLELHKPSENYERKLKPLYPQNIQRFKIYELSYNDFYWLYMEGNVPVVLCEVSLEWECARQWVKKSVPSRNDNHDNQLQANESTFSINYDYLKENIGNRLVPVANCNMVYFNSHAKTEMLFYDFLNYWKQKRGDNTCPAEELAYSNRDIQSTDLLYLKDWHLKAQQPYYDFYKVPKHFASDWLNEYLLATANDDYRFVYMGPKDTW